MVLIFFITAACLQRSHSVVCRFFCASKCCGFCIKSNQSINNKDWDEESVRFCLSIFDVLPLTLRKLICSMFACCARDHHIIPFKSIFIESESLIAKIQIIWTQFGHLIRPISPFPTQKLPLCAFFGTFLIFLWTKVKQMRWRANESVRAFNEVKQWTIFINSVCKFNERSSKKSVSDCKFLMQNAELNENFFALFILSPKTASIYEANTKEYFANCNEYVRNGEMLTNWKSSACSCCTTGLKWTQEESIGKHELLFRKMHPNLRMYLSCAREQPSCCPKLQIMLQCQESAHYSKFLPSREWQINLFVECDGFGGGCGAGGRRTKWTMLCNYIANALHWYEKQFQTGKCHFQRFHRNSLCVCVFVYLIPLCVSFALFFFLKFVFFIRLCNISFAINPCFKRCYVKGLWRRSKSQTHNNVPHYLYQKSQKSQTTFYLEHLSISICWVSISSSFSNKLRHCHWVLLLISLPYAQFYFYLSKLLCYRHHLNKFSPKNVNVIASKRIASMFSYLLRSCFQSNCLICCLIYFSNGFHPSIETTIFHQKHQTFPASKNKWNEQYSIGGNEINVNWDISSSTLWLQAKAHMKRTRAISAENKNGFVCIWHSLILPCKRINQNQRLQELKWKCRFAWIHPLNVWNLIT